MMHEHIYLLCIVPRGLRERGGTASGRYSAGVITSASDNVRAYLPRSKQCRKEAKYGLRIRMKQAAVESRELTCSGSDNTDAQACGQYR